MNPFDLNTYDLPTLDIGAMDNQLAMDRAISTKIPYFDIELPINKVELPKQTYDFLNNYSSNNLQSTTQPTKESAVIKQDNDLYNQLVQTPYKKDTVSYSYSANLDTRYKDLDYDPNKDMEKIYDEKQTGWDVFKKQNSRLWNNLSNSVRDQYIGQGRMIYDLGKGQLNNDSFFNKPETLASYLNSLNEETYNPIFGKESAQWYNGRGWLGDTYASSGFAMGAMVGGVIDYGVGALQKAAVSTGLGAAALGLGTLSLFNDSVRDTIGEENANIMIGMMGGGLLSNAIGGGINALTRSVPQASIPILQSALKQFKNSDDFTKILNSTVENTLSKLTGGTIFDSTAQLAKNVKLSNTINKGLTAGLTGAKMYLSSGAESGMEAIQAQYDYIGEKMTEAQKKGTSLSDEEYQKVYNESLDMSKKVYNMNRLLLGASNSIQFGDIIKGTFVKDKLKDYGIEYIKGQSLNESFKIIGSPLKTWYKNQIVSSLSEGFEEGGQYIISEANKDYLKNQEKKKAAFDSFLYGIEETLTTSQGWSNIMSGIFTGLAMSQPASLVRGISQANNGGTFLGGYTGFDKKQSEAVVETLKNKFKNIYGVTTNNQEFNDIFDSIDRLDDSQVKDLLNAGDRGTGNLNRQKQRIIDTLFSNAAIGIETGNAKMMRSFIEDYFAKDNIQNTITSNEGTSVAKTESNYDKLIKVYGTAEEVEKTKATILNTFDKAESTIKNFQEYYNNPYTVSLIDNAFENKFINKITEKFGIKKETVNAKKEKAAIFDSLVQGAARTMFMQQEQLEELSKKRLELVKFLDDNLSNKNSVVDLKPYVLGNRKSYSSLMADLRFEIQSLKDPTTLSPEQVLILGQTSAVGQTKQLTIEEEIRLQKLEDLLFRLKDDEYEKILNGENEVDKDYVENRQSPIYKVALEEWVKAATGKKVEDLDKESMNFHTLRFKSILEEVNQLEESVYFFSKDLKGFTSEKDQKKIVDYIFDAAANMKSQQLKIKLKLKEADKAKEAALAANNTATFNTPPPEPPISGSTVTPSNTKLTYTQVYVKYKDLLDNKGITLTDILEHIETRNKATDPRFSGVEFLNTTEVEKLKVDLNNYNNSKSVSNYDTILAEIENVVSRYDDTVNSINSVILNKGIKWAGVETLTQNEQFKLLAYFQEKARIQNAAVNNFTLNQSVQNNQPTENSNTIFTSVQDELREFNEIIGDIKFNTPINIDGLFGNIDFNTGSKYVNQFLKQIRKTLTKNNVKIIITEDIVKGVELAAGAYSTKHNAIVISLPNLVNMYEKILTKQARGKNGQFSQISRADSISELLKMVLLHESIHSFTAVATEDYRNNVINKQKASVLDNNQIEAITHLSEILKFLKTKPELKEYGLENIDELMAEMANEDFTQKLNSITLPLNLQSKEKQPLYDLLINLLSKFLGLKTEDNSTFKGVLKVIDVFEKSETIKNIQFEKKATTEYVSAENRLQEVLKNKYKIQNTTVSNTNTNNIVNKKIVKIYHHTELEPNNFKFDTFKRDNPTSQFGNGLNVTTENTEYFRGRFGRNKNKQPIEGEIDESEFVVIDSNKNSIEIQKELTDKGFKFTEKFDDTDALNASPGLAMELFTDFQKNNPNVKGVKLLNHKLDNVTIKPFYVIYDSKSFYGGNSLSNSNVSVTSESSELDDEIENIRKEEINELNTNFKGTVVFVPVRGNKPVKRTIKSFSNNAGLKVEFEDGVITDVSNLDTDNLNIVFKALFDTIYNKYDKLITDVQNNSNVYESIESLELNTIEKIEEARQKEINNLGEDVFDSWKNYFNIVGNKVEFNGKQGLKKELEDFFSKQIATSKIINIDYDGKGGLDIEWNIEKSITATANLNFVSMWGGKITFMGTSLYDWGKNLINNKYNKLKKDLKNIQSATNQPIVNTPAEEVDDIIPLLSDIHYEKIKEDIEFFKGTLSEGNTTFIIEAIKMDKPYLIGYKFKTTDKNGITEDFYIQSFVGIENPPEDIPEDEFNEMLEDVTNIFNLMNTDEQGYEEAGLSKETVKNITQLAGFNILSIDC